jgi:DNA processing protein
VYPREHLGLAQAIGDAGLLVSELAPGSGPKAWHFPRRNRIIAALSIGILVVEAAERSGSLITARLGCELGREIFAIPGSIDSPLSYFNRGLSWFNPQKTSLRSYQNGQKPVLKVFKVLF